jgi:hypothetical protein
VGLGDVMPEQVRQGAPTHFQASRASFDHHVTYELPAGRVYSLPHRAGAGMNKDIYRGN